MDIPCDTVLETLGQRVAPSGSRHGYFVRDASGVWTGAAWREMWDRSLALAHLLRERGVRPGERIAICMPTCAAWQVAEFAAWFCGAVSVGIDAHASLDHRRYLIEHSRAVGIIGSDTEPLSGFDALPGRLRFAVVAENSPAEAAGISTESWPAPSMAPDPLPTPRADDPATLVYTSGTTGTPKGIAFTHRQLAVACREICRCFPQIGPRDSIICWLPMAHLFQRMLNYVAIAKGAQAYFWNDPRTIVDGLRSVHPTVFVGVPRFFEKLGSEMEASIDRLPRIVRGVVHTALERRKRDPQAWRPLGGFLGARIRRATFGRRIRHVISGSAPLPLDVLKRLQAIGITVLEAYGVSENAVPLALNRPADYRLGSVGKPLAGNEVRLGADGEVLVRGSGLFEAYEAPGETPPFDADGYYATGDLGHFDGDGFLYLTGRRSEIVKTSGGRRISLARVEAVYRRSPLVQDIVVVGHGRPRLVALVSVNHDAVRRAAGDAPPSPSGVKEMVLESLERAAEPELARYERVAAIHLVDRPFSIESGEVTPSLKLRRSFIEDHYAHLIRDMYAEPGHPVSEEARA